MYAEISLLFYLINSLSFSIDVTRNKSEHLWTKSVLFCLQNTHFYDQQHRLCMEYRNASQNSNTGRQISGVGKLAGSQDNAVSLRCPGGVTVSNACLLTPTVGHHQACFMWSELKEHSSQWTTGLFSSRHHVGCSNNPGAEEPSS